MVLPKSKLVLSWNTLFAHHPSGRNKIFGFHQLDATSVDLLSYASSLIITRGDFANYQHRDNDIVDLAYGLWWAGLWDESTQRYILSDDCDHDMVSGGSFLFSGYGYGIQFEKFVPYWCQ